MATGGIAEAGGAGPATPYPIPTGGGKRVVEVGVAGLEGPPKSPCFPGSSDQRGTESGTVGAQNGPAPPDLAALAAALLTLSPGDRERLAAMLTGDA